MLSAVTESKRDLVSICDLSKDEIEHILRFAKEMKEKKPSDLCKGQILAICFYEPSTRTRLSFEAAMQKLGGSCIGFAEGAITSASKGETLYDAMRVIGSYVDAIAFRHPHDGAARVAADASQKPLINAGDGANQHPTQTLIDLFTIQSLFGTLEHLHIAVSGDLKHARAVHSLIKALSYYPVRLYFIAPEPFQLADRDAAELRKKGVKFSFHVDFAEVLPKVDLLYMTRIQKERFAAPFVPIERLKKEHLENVKPHFRILHPLPRQEELAASFDASPYAAYFQQASNGVAVRMAVLATLLEKL